MTPYLVWMVFLVIITLVSLPIALALTFGKDPNDKANHH